jgi:hypothetical protein
LEPQRSETWVGQGGTRMARADVRPFPVRPCHCSTAGCPPIDQVVPVLGLLMAGVSGVDLRSPGATRVDVDHGGRGAPRTAHSTGTAPRCQRRRPRRDALPHLQSRSEWLLSRRSKRSAVGGKRRPSSRDSGSFPGDTDAQPYATTRKRAHGGDGFGEQPRLALDHTGDRVCRNLLGVCGELAECGMRLQHLVLGRTEARELPD